AFLHSTPRTQASRLLLLIRQILTRRGTRPFLPYLKWTPKPGSILARSSTKRLAHRSVSCRGIPRRDAGCNKPTVAVLPLTKTTQNDVAIRPIERDRHGLHPSC